MTDLSPQEQIKKYIEEWPVSRTIKMTNHTCKEIDYCICDTMALEPNEQCIKHGAGPWPPRCIICGRFMKWPVYKEAL